MSDIEKSAQIAEEMLNNIRLAEVSQREDRLFAFARAAMQKLIIISPVSKGQDKGLRYELDCKIAWAMARSMMEAKEKHDAENQ